MPKMTLDYILEHQDELAKRFEDFDASQATRMSEGALALFRAAHRRATVERDILDAVRLARTEEMSWAEVGKRLGVTAQAAHAKYAGLIDD